MIKTLFSKQNWLIKKLPCKQISNDELIRDCLFNILEHFVENDNGFENNYWFDGDEVNSVKAKLQDCYVWITQEREILLSKLEQTIKDFPDVPENDSLLKFLTDRYVQDVTKLQQELKDKDDAVLETILKHREYLTIVQ